MGTVLALGLCSLICLTAIVATLLAQAATVRHRAGAAADLAALAAARAGADNVPAPCRAARVVAAHNGAHIRTCVVTGRGDARVSVFVDGTGLAHVRLRGSGSAHAAPAG